MSPSAAPDNSCIPLLANLTVSTEAVCPNNEKYIYTYLSTMDVVDNTHVCKHRVISIQEVIHINYRFP
jgi:hypothetical protein